MRPSFFWRQVTLVLRNVSPARVLILMLGLFALAAGCTTAAESPAPRSESSTTASVGHAVQICGSQILDSPYTYNGRPGRYKSGAPGLPTYGTRGSDFPHAKAGVVLAAERRGYLSYQLNPDTVYYLLPGTHIGYFQANANDAFVGGFANGQRTILSGDYSGYNWAIDSNYSNGDQAGVTIEYLTIENYQPNADAAAINQSSNTGWTLQYDTITRNVPGAGVLAGAGNALRDNCMTLNGQYGFQSSDDAPWGRDSLTGGPYGVTIEHNEISYNDTCDFEGLLTNATIGWYNYNPVPATYKNPHCGKVIGDGNQGGFKLWRTNGVTIEGNYVHNNWGPGMWADADNANTTYVGNTITKNDGEAIIEEISYNFSIRNNYMADNGWAVGLSNSGFPVPAIYISESGSSSAGGGIPKCREALCASQEAYPSRSVITGNRLVDNGGGIFLWQNSDRHCAGEFDSVCTLVAGAGAGPFTLSSCRSNLPSSSIDTTTYAGRHSGSPPEDWWDGCLWRTENTSISDNVIDFNPDKIAHCNWQAWPDCGANGMFSEYGIVPPYDLPGGWVIASQLTFFQNNVWAHNTYRGPSTFYAWNQGNGDNPVSWSEWTGDVAIGDKCDSPGEHQSGYCQGPFGQDSGSSFQAMPVS